MSQGTKEELERRRARWWATVSSGDLDGYLALFAEDAVWVTPELDEIVGRQAIRAWLEPVFAQFDYELTITVADVRVAGDLGIERARFVSRMTPKPPPLRPLPVTPPSPEPPAGDDGDGEGAGDHEPGPDAADVGAGPEVGDAAEVGDAPEVGDAAAVGAAPEADGAAEVGDAAEVGAAAEVTDGAERPQAADAAGDSEATSADHAPDLPPDAGAPVDAGDDRDAASDEAGADEPAVEAPLVPAGADAADDEPHEGRYLMYWRWHADAGWLVHRYADVTGVG